MLKVFSFIADGELFAADINIIKKVARNMTITPVPAAPDSVVGITNVKGRVVTVLSITELLGRRDKKNGHVSGNIVIFKSFSDDGNKLGLLMDEPGDLIEIDGEGTMPLPLDSDERAKRHLSGLAEVGGRLYRIINVDSIMKRYTEDSHVSVNMK